MLARELVQLPLAGGPGDDRLRGRARVLALGGAALPHRLRLALGPRDRGSRRQQRAQPRRVQGHLQLGAGHPRRCGPLLDRAHLRRQVAGIVLGLRRLALQTFRACAQQPRDGARRRVVEDQGRGKLHAGCAAEPVAQLDRGDRVEAQLLERAVAVDRLR